MRSSLRIKTLTVIALATATGTIMCWPAQSRISEENFNRITSGMDRSEVEAILGPPGDYRTGLTVSAEEPGCEYGKYPPGMIPLFDSFGHWQAQAANWLKWETDSAEITVGIMPPDQVGPIVLGIRLPNSLGTDLPETPGVISARYSKRKLEYSPVYNLLLRAKRWWAKMAVDLA
jgi:hypothetical protein